MAKKVEIELDIKSNAGQSINDLKALKKQLKELPAGTAEWDKVFNQIDDLEDKIKGAKKGSSDWIDSLESAGGPLGMLGAGLNKAKVATTSFGSALKATGIGLIVAAIGGLVAAFSETEGAMKKLDPLIIGLQKILGGIFEALTPLIDSFVELATDALPYVTKGIGYFYSALVALFTYFQKTGGAVAKIWKGIFTFNWKTIKEGVSDLTSSFGKVADSFTDTMAAFEKGTGKITKKEKENAKDAKEIADKALAEKLKHMDAQDKIDQATLEKMKAEAMQYATTEQQKLDVEKVFAKKSYDLKEKELKEKQALYKKDSDEYKGYTADLIKLDTDYINTKNTNDQKQRDLDIAKRKEFYEKDKAQFQSQMDERQRNRDDANEKELQALDLKLKKGEIKEFEYQEQLYKLKQQQLSKGMDQLNFAEQQEKMHYENLYQRNKIGKEDYEAALLDISKRYGDQKLQNLKDQGTNEFNEALRLSQLLVATKQYEKDSIIALEEAKINAVATLGGILSQLAGQNKTIAILGLAVSQGAAIADILTKYFRNKAELSLARATYTAMIPNPLTSAIGIAGVAATTAGLTAGTITLGASLAGVAAAVAQGISAINSSGGASSGVGTAAGPGASAQSLGKNYGDGGMIEGPRHAGGGVMINAEGGEAVMSRGSVTMFGPLLSQLNQMGGGTSFNKGAIGQASYDNPQLSNPVSEPMVLKTYVVENELTSIQHKQARLKDLSTL